MRSGLNAGSKRRNPYLVGDFRGSAKPEPSKLTGNYRQWTSSSVSARSPSDLVRGLDIRTEQPASPAGVTSRMHLHTDRSQRRSGNSVAQRSAP